MRPKKLCPCAMEAFEHRSNPESDEPDQAKRMQTSMSNLTGKAISKIIAKDILRHTKAIWQKSDHFGFLPGRNSRAAVVKVIDDWEHALDKKETIHAIFFDFRKAFDLVNHKRLIELRRMGFTEDKLLCVYKSLVLSQYIYGDPLFAAATQTSIKQMQAQQRRFLGFIGISTERALRVHNIKPMEDFLNEQSSNESSRILTTR
jgi:hypothetical protein